MSFMPKDRLPQQKDCDPTKPDEQFLWMLVAIPYGDRANQIIQTQVARAMSLHLSECGAVDANYLRTLADENGMIHVDQLPEQKRRLIVPHRGQQSTYNASYVWAPMDAEEEEPVVLPNVKAMTRHEQELIKNELDDLGLIDHPAEYTGKPAHVTNARDKVPDWRTLPSEKIKKAGDIT